MKDTLEVIEIDMRGQRTTLHLKDPNHSEKRCVTFTTDSLHEHLMKMAQRRDEVNALLGKWFRTIIKNCARCQGVHNDLLFEELKGESVAGRIGDYSVEFTHWAFCPTTLQPILLTHCAKPGRTADNSGSNHGKDSGK